MALAPKTSGDSWISHDAGDLRIAQTRYTGHRLEARYPAFKINVVRNLLETTGRLPAAEGGAP